jgi:hypothetical protein
VGVGDEDPLPIEPLLCQARGTVPKPALGQDQATKPSPARVPCRARSRRPSGWSVPCRPNCGIGWGRNYCRSSARAPTSRSVSISARRSTAMWRQA